MHNPKLLRTARRLLPGWLRARLDPFHAAIEQALGRFAASLPEGSRVLDAGAGECAHRPLFAHARYVAVDNAGGDAAWDYRRLSVVAELESLPFAAASFDAALSVVTLEHVGSPPAALAELRRVLGGGGRLFIAVPQFWELHQAPQDYFRYTRCGLERLLREAGFEITELRPTGGYFHLMGKLSIDFLQFFEHGPGWILWVLLAPLYGVIAPFFCYYLDFLDRKKDFAVGFIAVAQAAVCARSGAEAAESSAVEQPISAEVSLP